MATHSRILAWRIPWTEEPVCSPWGGKESGTTELLTLSLLSPAIYSPLETLQCSPNVVLEF